MLWAPFNFVVTIFAKVHILLIGREESEGAICGEEDADAEGMVAHLWDPF